MSQGSGPSGATKAACGRRRASIGASPIRSLPSAPTPCSRTTSWRGGPGRRGGRRGPDRMAISSPRDSGARPIHCLPSGARAIMFAAPRSGRPDQSQAWCPHAPRDRMLKGADFLPLPQPGDQPTVTRFAPTPSGYLHLGHAYAALVACESARAAGGRFLLRIEDIDRARCRPEFEQGILEDLRWLGLDWDGEPVRQSERMALYDQALDRLDRLGVLYPCFCTRRRIRAEIEHAGRAPHGPAGRGALSGHLPQPEPGRAAPADRRGRALRAASRRRARAGTDRAARLGRPARRPDRGAAGFARRRRARAQGRAEQLPSGGDGRRRPAGRHARDPRRGPVPGHPCSPPAAGAPRARARRATTTTT